MNVGIVGGGQLGLMLASAALPWGIRCRVLDPTIGCPASQVAEHIVGEYDDYAALAEFVAGLDRVTYEFENVPVATARWLGDRLPVDPASVALETAQDRLHEKAFFQALGADVPEFRSIATEAEFRAGMDEIGLPAVLKTRRFGYDGKGQCVIRTLKEAGPAWERLGGRPLILEQYIPFDREVSAIATRDHAGDIAHYPLVENVHVEGILRESRTADLGDQISARARAVVERAMDRFGYVGVLAIEFFVVGDRLIVNEMAPRVHNSGHWTIEAAATSQFANHMRAIVGWPVGSTQVYCSAGMLNCLGSMPDAGSVAKIPGATLHDYHKQPRAGRKVGHVAVTAGTDAERDERMAAVRRVLGA